ncbi:SprT-like domain-containing protein [uncultured Phascolarctobacterium sp.]|jgi:hypothetical protein|uniref:SprT-like domain-containing protein Spartan repair protease, DNA BINDING n=1 Tax=Caudovirales sp. ctIZM3 TaxID=2827633 RepID=A0A8S5T7Z1_9CAUD|nr:SprT-like domain-containing protein [uncultured Phascolarctobacterium sp.]DAF59461.1 MAG TPA: SprT-like domain-containing protein Spartan repair protease, DNA BINDING [Caudovirales sp. ctIZM3]
MANNYNLKPQNEIKDFSDRILELEELYRRTNEVIFAVHAKKIDLPVFVTIQSRGKRRAYGWCYLVPNWADSSGENRVAYEINIAAETLGRPLEETYTTLVHEMVHLYNCQEGIKDTADRSDRHNKKFGATCSLIGLANRADKVLGWTTHCPWSESSAELHALLESYKQEGRPELLQVNRMDDKGNLWKPTTGGTGEGGEEGEGGENTTKKRKKSNQIKYVCPCCGTSVRATKKVNIMCADCKESMLPEEQED